MKKLYILCGAPGSGKSYYAKHTLITDNTWAYVSRDEIRFSLVREDEDYFSKEDEVYNEFCKRINDYLHCEDYSNVIADASHLNTKARMKLINRLNLDEVQVIPVWFDTPLEICYKRNDGREGRANVPHSAIANMYRSKQHPQKDKYPYAAIMEVSYAICNK